MTRPISSCFALIVLNLFICGLLKAQSPVINLGDVPSLEISDSIDIFLDESKTRTIQELSEPSFSGWKRNSELFPTFGTFAGTAWLRFAVENTSPHEEQQVLLLNAAVQDVRLYFINEQGQMVEQKAGRIHTDGTETFPNAMPRFVLSIKPAQTIVYWMSIKSNFVYNIKLSLNSQEGFYQNQRAAHYFSGFFVGVMLIMILYNFFIYVSTRDTAYLWYVLTVLCLHLGMIGQLVTNGDYFGIKSPILPANDSWIAKCLGFIFLIQFSRVFLQTYQSSSKYDLFLKFNIAVSVLLLVLGYFLPVAKVNAIHNIFVVTTVISLIVYSGRLFSQGFSYARYYFLAWFPVLLVAITLIGLNMTKKSHLMPNMGLLLCIAACVEVLLLSMALGDKFNEIRKAKELADLEHKETILAMNRSLEAKVKEKTRDISSMLDNLKLGIFTVNHQLLVSPEHSQHLRTMVSSASIESQSFSNILFENTELGGDVKNQVEAAIFSSTDIDDLGYDANSHLLIRQLQKKTKHETRDIEIDWSPIQNDKGIVEKVLVCMKDVTEFNQLKREGETQKRRMDMLSQYMSADRAQIQKLELHLLTLIKDAQHIHHRDVMSWSENDKSEYASELFAQLHTDKAWSRTLKLTYLSDAIHEGEHYLHELKQVGGMMSIEKIHSLLNQIGAILDEYHRSVAHLGLTPRADHAKDQGESFEALLVRVLSERIPLASKLGKPVPLIKFNTHESIELNAELEQTLETLLIHFLRNSLDHGIEAPDERRKKEKSEQGAITVILKKLNTDYVLEYQDDGQGLDLDRIYAKALEKGLVSASAPLKKEEVAELIFSSGFSTKEKVTDISGRGVGLDAVRRQVKALNGSIGIQLLENTVPGNFGRWSIAFCFTWPCASEPVLKTGS